MPGRSSEQSISRLVSELWWLWVVQALLSILFGVAAVFWPGITLVVLVYLLSAFVIALGITEVVRGLMSVRTRDTWWMTIIIGILLLGVGLYLTRNPELTLRAFTLIVGLTFITWGIVDVIRAFIDRTPGFHKTLSYIAGIAGVVAGVITLLQPVAGGLAFVWVWGLYAFIYGTVALALAIEHHRDYEEIRTTLQS